MGLQLHPPWGNQHPDLTNGLQQIFSDPVVDGFEIRTIGGKENSIGDVFAKFGRDHLAYCTFDLEGQLGH